MAPSRHEIPVQSVNSFPRLDFHVSAACFAPSHYSKYIHSWGYFNLTSSELSNFHYASHISSPARITRFTVIQDEKDPSCKFERHRWHGKFLWKELWKEIDGRGKDKKRWDGKNDPGVNRTRWRSRISRTLARLYRTSSLCSP